jgi:hypothetical protein
MFAKHKEIWSDVKEVHVLKKLLFQCNSKCIAQRISREDYESSSRLTKCYQKLLNFTYKID